MKKISLIFILFCSMWCRAQSSLIHQMMLDAKKDSTTWEIKLPSASIISEQSPVALTSWITQDGGELLFSFSDIPIIDKNFNMHSWGGYRYLGVDLSLGNFTVGLDISKQVESHHSFSNQWFDLIRLGNVPLADQQVDLRFQSTLFSYQKNAVSLAYKHKSWTLGLAASYLMGRSDLQIATNRFNYQLVSTGFIWEIDADIEVKSTSLQTLSDLSQTEFSFPIIESPSFSTKNPGFSADIWAQYKLNDRWNLSAIIRDVGFINWNDHATVYSRDGLTDFEGLDLKTIIIQQEEIGLVDTLNALLGLSVDSTNYTQSLSASVELAANYQMTKQLDLFGSLSYKNGFYSSIIRMSAGAQYHFNESFSVHGIYTFDNHTPFILDVGFTWDASPFYLQASASNPWLMSNGLLADYYAWQATAGLKF